MCIKKVKVLCKLQKELNYLFLKLLPQNNFM